MQGVCSSSQCMSGPILRCLPYAEMPDFHSKPGKIYPPWPRILLSQFYRNHSIFYTKITKTGSNVKSKTKLWHMVCPIFRGITPLSLELPSQFPTEPSEWKPLRPHAVPRNRERCWSVSLPKDASSCPLSFHNCYSIKSLHIGETCNLTEPAPSSLRTFHSES